MNKFYNDLVNHNEKRLRELEIRLKDTLDSNQTELNSYFEKFLFNNAKRLRPLFIFSVCDFLNLDIDEKIISFACAIELLHSASLIHDDILDDGKKRRGLVCLNFEKGDKTAVLAGDYLLSTVMQLVYEIGNIEIVNIMAKISYEMTKSEISALKNRFNNKNLNDYLIYSKEKTSPLFKGAVIGVGEIKNVKIDKSLIDFAENFALCFQIKDDINNFKNKDKNKISSDKNNGICTLPEILNSCGIIESADLFLDNLINKTKNIIKSKDKDQKLTAYLNIFNED